MQQILTQRLQNQLLLDHDFQNPEQVVKHMLCMQSQDFKQHLRAISSRCWCSREDIEDAYNQWLIVKWWTQRGTIHVVCAEDFQRMTALCASKTLNGFAKRRAFLWITDQIILHAEEIIRKILSSGPKTRDTISNALKESGIPMQTGRNYHILCHLGTQGIIVQWPIIEGDHAFVLTEQRIGDSNKYNEEQALQELCIRYFTSHGPATLADLQWWSWLGITVLKKGVELAGDILNCDNGYYYRRDALHESKNWKRSEIWKADGSNQSLQPIIHFLAWYDERLLGYKDRTATLDLDHHTKVDVSRNGVFKPTVMIDGKTVAIRSSKEKKSQCDVTITQFDTSRNLDFEKSSHNLTDYENFIGEKMLIH
jgi:hypothetical protein